MATIQEGDTIQAAWFDNVDSTGVFKKDITFLNDANPINIVHDSQNLMQIETDGDTKIKGDFEPNADI